MHTKILAVVYVVLAAFLLVASAHVARADEQPATGADRQVWRDFYECLQPASLLLLPDANNIQTCMLMKGYSDEETTGFLESLPDQELYAPYTGVRGH